VTSSFAARLRSRDFAIRSARVVTPDGVRDATVEIRDGVIASLSAWTSARRDVLDVGDDVVMPGLVDTHVHVNEPGRTDWEGFETATRAAAAGGVTTILDMPLNSIPATTTLAALEEKHRAADGKCWVNVGFLGGVVPGNSHDLARLWDAGVFGYKCFLTPSGVDEFPSVGEPELREALPVLASLGATLMVHAERPEYLVDPRGDGRVYASYLASRPPAAETAAIELVARLAAEFRARIHIVHVSAAESIDTIRRARSAGVAMTAETCPHYLSFTAGEIADGATERKCAPPIRSAEHRDALWAGLQSGVLDMVVSDHSPCPPALKARETGDFFAAWGGIASLQLGLSAVWHGARARNLGVERVAAWMGTAPARLAALDHRKGSIVPGYDADIVIWQPDASFVVREEALYHRHKLTPYLGHTLPGRVRASFVGGQPAYLDGEVSPTPVGRLYTRTAR
jgi:allantoinase